MTHLALQLPFGTDEFFGANGIWLFLSVGAVALFGIFLPIVSWIDSRRKEREAFYRAETFRRVAEAPGESGTSAVQLLREQERMQAIKTREGLKIGGVINVGVGTGLIIFLHAMLGGGSAYLCGLIPLFIGVAMIVYVYVMAPSIE